MEITVRGSGWGVEVCTTAENVKIEEGISSSVYALKEDGKKDFSKRIGEDIDDNYMNMFINVLDDIIYYRKKEVDSSALIERLFEKLPTDKQTTLLTTLKSDYEE